MLAGVMVVTLVERPSPRRRNWDSLQAIQAVLNVINGVIQTALTSINTVRSAMNNLQQLVVWPAVDQPGESAGDTDDWAVPKPDEQYLPDKAQQCHIANSTSARGRHQGPSGGQFSASDI